ncbi:hypothetical protein [Acinetobacter schindleri]|jgi:hypothetical protein|uniref:hypothetical protein n=1 Tax=Acinetobacter schindleri TaxID=108981 RepID=UPI0022F3ECFC|nr:hypothetical protein [Acinetobacter schindleri]WBX38968.1 hypothetical protein MYA84_04815 [Acinetobacter schindleri]
MKMNISSIEKHQRSHSYNFGQNELEQLALATVAKELGLDLTQNNLKVEVSLSSQSGGINPTTYSCKVVITENLDCKE